MKLLTFKRIEDKENKYGIDPEGECDWFVWLETLEEHMAYQEYIRDSADDKLTEAHRAWVEGRWAGYTLVKLGDTYYDDDIYYYFLPEDDVPKVGETFELDGLLWERIK